MTSAAWLLWGLIAAGWMAAGAIAAWLWLSRPPAMQATVIVQLVGKGDEAIRGVLWSSRGAWLTFKGCEALKVGQPPTAMDGEVVLHRSQVAFLQVVQR